MKEKVQKRSFVHKATRSDKQIVLMHFLISNTHNTKINKQKLTTVTNLLLYYTIGVCPVDRVTSKSASQNQRQTQW